jgi:ribosomal protein S18 acetylase RimI-like enzyme
MTSDELTVRQLRDDELGRVAEIDRTEQIDAIFVQRGTELESRPGDWSAPPWDPDGDGEHSVAAHVREVARSVDAGGTALGAFDGSRLVGLGVVLPHLRPGIAQLAWLHVTAGQRDAGIGRRLCGALEAIAKGAGDDRIVVSATPSEHTVGFYRRRGYQVMAEPLPELYAREPEDVHLEKRL